MQKINTLFSLLLLVLYSGILNVPESGAQDTFYKFPITKEGVYKITAAQANQLGANSVEDLTIYGYNGMLPQKLDRGIFDLQEVPVKILNGALYVFLTTAPTIEIKEGVPVYQTHHYTDTLYYLVQTQQQAAAAIPKVTVDGTTDSLQGILYKAIAYKNEEYNLLSSGRSWYGERVFSGETIILNFEEKAKNNLPIYYQGKLMAQSLEASTFKISLNQSQIQTTTLPSITNSTYGLKGQETQTAGFADLPLDNEQIQLKIHYKTSDSNGMGYLNHFMLGYPFPTNQLSSGIYYNFTNQSFDLQLSEGQNAWDVSDFHNVKDITSSVPIRYNSQKIAVFREAETPALASFEQVEVGLRFNPEFAELLIITHPILKPQAERLAAHKNSLGISTQVRTVQEIYDAFGYGNPDVTAIRDFLAFHYHQGQQLKNILLFGKGTFDYKNKLQGRPNLVPTYSSRSSLNPLTTYSSDDYFGFMNFGEGIWEETNEGDLRLSIGVGRLPVINGREAKNVVDKIIQYESTATTPGNWKRKILFVADDGDNNVHLNNSELLASYLSQNHPELVLEKLYLDDFKQTSTGNGQNSPLAKEKFETLMDSSLLMVNYIGHGSETTLMAEELFAVSDLNNWRENAKLPVFITATCEFGRHDSPFIRSGAEELLITEKKGSIAMLSTGRPVFSNVNFSLNQAFIKSLLKKEEGHNLTLGEIFKQTKNNSLNGPLNRNFSLLGDPSLKLALPEFSVESGGLVDSHLQYEVDTIKSMQQIRYKGRIVDPLTGAAVHSFNGSFEVIVSDKPQIITTLGDETVPGTYLNEQVYLHRGYGTVQNGSFEGEFLVPKNINNSFGEGTIKFFAQQDNAQKEAFGAAKVIIGGSSSPIDDNEGPIIHLARADNGEIETPSASTTLQFLATLEDPSGININPLTPDQEISVQVNEGEKINLNKYYKALNGYFTQGKMEFPINNLKEGLNKIVFEAWDNQGNSSSKTVEIQADGSTKARILNHMIYPNPATDHIEFEVAHNRRGENVVVEVKIFSFPGNEIFSMSRRFPKADPLLEGISWIFVQSKTKYPAKGTYLYILELKSEEDDSTDRKSGKLIIR